MDELDAGGVDADVVGGPSAPELVAAGGELSDQVGEVAVGGVAARFGAQDRDGVVGDGVPIAEDQTFAATLDNSQVARDFAQMPPVTLPWFRNADIEYITELDAPMTETGPFYTDVQPGDLVYYNPLDSITIIYEETGSVPTLTKMGEITTSNLDSFEDLPDNVDMRIEAG